MNQRFCNGIIHVIKSGDNLYQLSRKYRVPLALILRANPYVDVYNLRPGQEICIPMRRPSGAFPNRPETPPQENQPQAPQQTPPQQQTPPPPQARMEEEVAEEVVAEEEEKEEELTYCCDGTKTLGEILNDTGMTMEEFWEENDPNTIVPVPKESLTKA